MMHLLALALLLGASTASAEDISVSGPDGHIRQYETEPATKWRSRVTGWVGDFILPGDVVEEELRSTEPVAEGHPAGCGIKGNISRSGERIYHQPGQQHYGRTRIDVAQGEHWFCSAEEAEAAGWRAART